MSGYLELNPFFTPTEHDTHFYISQQTTASSTFIVQTPHKHTPTHTPITNWMRRNQSPTIRI
jgi:hypothetical protein